MGFIVITQPGKQVLAYGPFTESKDADEWADKYFHTYDIHELVTPGGAQKPNALAQMLTKTLQQSQSKKDDETEVVDGVPVDES